jgi:hypothetical protein
LKQSWLDILLRLLVHLRRTIKTESITLAVQITWTWLLLVLLRRREKERTHKHDASLCLIGRFSIRARLNSLEIREMLYPTKFDTRRSGCLLAWQMLYLASIGFHTHRRLSISLFSGDIQYPRYDKMKVIINDYMSERASTDSASSL